MVVTPQSKDILGVGLVASILKAAVEVLLRMEVHPPTLEGTNAMRRPLFEWSSSGPPPALACEITQLPSLLANNPKLTSMCTGSRLRTRGKCLPM